MDEIFTMKTNTSIHGDEKKNNAQIVSTLRSETEIDNDINNTDVLNMQKNTTNGTNITNSVNTLKIGKTHDKQYVEIRKNDLEILQEDIVSLAESIHNLVKMLDEQREKMNFVEKEISKIGTIENEISKINDNVKNVAEVTKYNQQPNQILNRDISNDSYISSSNTMSSLSQKNYNKKDIIFFKQKIQPSKCQSKSSLTTDTVTVTESSVSDSQSNSNSNSNSNCGYNNSKEVEEKLNNITKGFNDELLDMKRKQALLAASYVKKNKMR
jgi:hypothetical protein